MNIEIKDIKQLLVLREALATIRGQVEYTKSELTNICDDLDDPYVQHMLPEINRKADAIDYLYRQAGDILKEQM